MPHNPRRLREPPLPEIDLSEERVRDAVNRAVAMRRRQAIPTQEVNGQPMHPRDAIEYNVRYRRYSYFFRIRHPDGETSDPWWMVGWVSQETARDETALLEPGQYSQSWEVWLNIESGQVWLKLDRQIARLTRAHDDPYP